MSIGNALVRNCVSGETIAGIVPSVQNSVFLRINLDDDEDLPLLRVVDVDDEEALLLAVA